MRTSYRRRLLDIRCLVFLSLFIGGIPAIIASEGDNGHLQTHGKKRSLNPSIGDNIKVLVLPIKFADHVDREVPTIEYLEEFFNGEGSSETNEVGSVREWLRRNSNGKYTVQFVVQDWDVSTRTEKETAGGKSGQGQNMFPFFQFALDKLDNDPEHDWWSGFVDEEGYLNHLIVMHSGYMAESSKSFWLLQFVLGF